MSTRATLKKLEGMSDEDFIAVLEMQIRSRPRLSRVAGYVIKRLSSALHPVLEKPSLSKAREDRGRRPRRVGSTKAAGGDQAAAGQKKARDAVLAHEMLDRAALVSRFKASTASSREATVLIRDQKARGALIELRDRNRSVYPAFQIDSAKGSLRPEVEEVNSILGAAKDPWGAASWWLLPHGRLGAAPVTLLGTRQSKRLVTMAQSIHDDSY
jgi:hypothetical protein